MPDRQTPQVHAPQFIKVSTLRLLNLTLVFFMFNLKPLFSNLAFQDVNFWQSSLTDTAIITRSSPYNNAHVQPFINASEIASTMMKRSWQRTEPWFTPTCTIIKTVSNAGFTSYFAVHCLDKLDNLFINPKLPHSPL